MILILSSGSSDVVELSKRITAGGIKCMTHFSTFADAGKYGRGSTVVGRIDYNSLCEIIRSNKIYGIVDAMSAPGGEESEIVMRAAQKMGIPYLKYLKRSFSNEDYPNVLTINSYKDIADIINQTIGNVLFYASACTVNAIAELTEDKERLYTVIPKGVDFDISIAMEYGLPLRNVIETEIVEGAENVLNTVDKYNIGLIVVDGSYSISDKAEAADKKNIRVIATQNTGVDCVDSADTYDAVCGKVLLWSVDNSFREGGKRVKNRNK